MHRMEAALAEIALEESVAEVEDDNDFIGQDGLQWFYCCIHD